MKVTIEFNLPEDRATLEDTLKVDDIKQVIYDMLEVLKGCKREGKDMLSIEQVREIIHQCLNNNGVVLN